MRRSALISLLFALALLAASCGTAAETDDATETETSEQEAAPIASSQVVQQFLESEEGAQLERTATPDAAWEQLGLGLNPTQREQRRYGTFTIYVVEPARTEAVTSLLSDKDTAEPIEESAGGIHWDFDELAGSYVAQKKYGPNVVLAWWNEREEPVTDERWERLDALMQELVEGR